MPVPDFQSDYFALFGLPAGFRVDASQLDRQFYALQAQVHPDRYTHLSETERRMSMQWATHVNEAYQTLRDPVRRARYLLSLQGVDTMEETNTAMPGDFLMRQMEWREAIEEAMQARDLPALETMESRLRGEIGGLQERLASNIDDEKDYKAASGNVRKLRFLEKLAEEIANSYDEIEN